MYCSSDPDHIAKIAEWPSGIRKPHHLPSSFGLQFVLLQGALIIRPNHISRELAQI
jgi:hypothetical protein